MMCRPRQRGSQHRQQQASASLSSLLQQPQPSNLCPHPHLQPQHAQRMQRARQSLRQQQGALGEVDQGRQLTSLQCPLSLHSSWTSRSRNSLPGSWPSHPHSSLHLKPSGSNLSPKAGPRSPCTSLMRMQPGLQKAAIPADHLQPLHRSSRQLPQLTDLPLKSKSSSSSSSLHRAACPPAHRSPCHQSLCPMLLKPW